MKVARATQEEEKNTGAEVAMGLGNMVKIQNPYVRKCHKPITFVQ